MFVYLKIKQLAACRPAHLLFCLLVASVFAAGSSTSGAQVLAIPAAATTGFVIDKLVERVNEAIARAEQAADYVLAQALRNLLTSLDAIKGTGNELLDKTFSSLTDQQRLFFRESDALLTNANADVQQALDKSTELVELAYQMSSDVRFFGRSRYVVLRYAPSYIVWERARQVTVTFRGINLGGSKPTLIIGARRIRASKELLQEATFKVPTDLVQQPRGKTVTVEAQVELTKPGLIRDTKILQNVTFVVLPNVVGKYSAILTYKQSVVEYSEVFRRDYEFQARNSVVKVTQPPTKGGDWRIDTASIRYDKYSGEASDGLYMDGPASPTGFTMAMNCREYYRDLSKHAGYGKGYWTWREFILKPTEQRFPIPYYGFLRLGKARYIALLPNTVAVSGTFVDFKGNEFMFSGTSRLPTVKVQQDKDRLVLTPTLSQDSEPVEGVVSSTPSLRDILQDVETEDYSNIDVLLTQLEEKNRTMAYPAPANSPLPAAQWVERERSAMLASLMVTRGLLAELQNARARAADLYELYSVEFRLHAVLTPEFFARADSVLRASGL